MSRPAVLLDRDGTINDDVNYLSDPDDLVFLPGAVAGLRKMAAMDLPLIVVTNQSGIARGYFTEADLTAVHVRLTQMLAAEGLVLAGIYHCPHEPEDGCGCRKPLPGMVESARRDIDFDPARSFMIGDKKADVDLGKAVGATRILVSTGYGAGQRAQGAQADAFVDSLDDAAAFIAEKLGIALPA